MKKLLDTHGRLLFSMILMVLAMIAFLATIPQMTISPSQRTREIAFVIEALALFGIMGMGMYVSYSQPTASDLVAAVKKRLADDESIIREWRSIEIRQLSFRDMSKMKKLGFVLVIACGLFFIITGFVDAFGFIKPAMARDFHHNVIRVIPRWQTATIEFAAGVISWVMTFVVRQGMIDRYDEGLRKLMKEMQGEKID